MGARDETFVPIATGIVKVLRNGKHIGYRAYQTVQDLTRPKKIRLRSKRFRKTATVRQMNDWRADVKVTAKKLPQPSAKATQTGFAGDALMYLEAVKAMPSIADRRLHIHDWMAIFGNTPRSEITSVRIRAQRDRWLTKGPRRELRKTPDGWKRVLVEKPLSPASVNKRLRALENLFTVLDGQRAENPVRQVPECDEPEALARGSSFEVIQEILRHIPELTSPIKGQKGSRLGPSKTRARLDAMLWTGLAHSQLAKLKPAHVDFQALTYLRPRRKKGRRGDRNRPVPQERPRPLLPQAAAALKHLFAIGADGPFSRSSLYKSWKRAIAAANEARRAAHEKTGRKGRPALIPMTLRPYDVKHTFGAEAYKVSKDLRAVQELLGLSRLELADRYAHAAIAPAAADAASLLAARAAAATGEGLPGNLTPQVNRSRKRA